MGKGSSLIAKGPLEQMAEAWAVFDDALRTMKGFNEEAYSFLKQAIGACSDSWADLDSIPRLAVNIFVDVFAATEANAGMYEGKSAERVMEAAYELHDLIGECVALP